MIGGTHDAGRNNQQIHGFRINSLTVHYFPHVKAFPNLIGISIENCHLKELNQKDLMLYPKLKELWLEKNDIKLLEEGLFDDNKELFYINLRSNKLLHIDQGVFEHIPKLAILYLNWNTCIDKQAPDKVTMMEAFKMLKTQCKDGKSDHWKLTAHKDDFETYRNFMNEKLKFFEEKLKQIIEFLLSSHG